MYIFKTVAIKMPFRTKIVLGGKGEYLDKQLGIEVGIPEAWLSAGTQGKQREMVKKMGVHGHGG